MSGPFPGPLSLCSGTTQLEGSETAAINVRRYKGRKVFRIRRHGLLVSRQFDNRLDAEAFAESTDGGLAGRAPAEGTTLVTLIERYRRVVGAGGRAVVERTINSVASRVLY